MPLPGSQKHADSVGSTTTSAPVNPISSSGNKESEAIGSGLSMEEIQLPEAVVSDELKDAGVVVHPDAPDIPLDLAQLGVQPSGPTQAFIPPSLPQVKLPLPDEEVEKGLHEQMTSSLRWLAQWCIRQLQLAHVTLKVVHGKVMRVRYG